MPNSPIGVLSSSVYGSSSFFSCIPCGEWTAAVVEPSSLRRSPREAAHLDQSLHAVPRPLGALLDVEGDCRGVSDF
jgi:hypothetical protein